VSVGQAIRAATLKATRRAAILAPVALRTAITATVATLALAAPAGAATAEVSIEATKFDPAILVIAPGTVVKWTNRDSSTRMLRGDVESPPIAPGKAFEQRFPRLGIFDYADGDNQLLTGTIIVGGVRGSRRYPSPDGPRIVTHRWRGSLRIDLRESWKYMDGKFLSFDGVCNAQVGRGARQVSLRASFPSVEYQRFGRLEVLTGKSSPYRIQRYRETIDSKSSNPGGLDSVDCGDGSSDAPPVVEQKCSHNYAGTRVRAELGWSPRVASGRFQWPHEYVGRRPSGEANCGHSFLAAGFLAGLDEDQLPWDPGAGSVLLYDHGRTSPVTQAEARALRDGRAVTIRRSFELQFTVDCCVEWHEPDKPGTYVRVGARHMARGAVTIRLTPR
jgi:plastocyanin